MPRQQKSGYGAVKQKKCDYGKKKDILGSMVNHCGQ